MKLSVIIPTLNEEAYLAETIDTLRDRTVGPPVELVVSDCGSADATREIATRRGAVLAVTPVPADRARACNVGTASATGDVLLFLHADSHVPAGYDRLIREALASSRAVGGAFEFKLDGPQWRLRLVELINRTRYRIRKRFYGDQGIFVRRSAFEAIGGFPSMPILEDAYLCADLCRQGSLRLVRAEMTTSPRRFYNGGILQTLARDIRIVVADILRRDPQRFAESYTRDNRRRCSASLVPTPTATRIDATSADCSALGVADASDRPNRPWKVRARDQSA